MQDDFTIITTCPSCNSKYKTSGCKLGNVISCKQCNTQFTVKEFDINKQIPLSGKLALKYKLINMEQLEQALQKQLEECQTGIKVPLEEIFVKTGMISFQLVGLLKAAKKFTEDRNLDKRFGTIAVNNNFTTSAEIEKALKIQADEFKEKKVTRLLGDILVESGAMTIENVHKVMIEQKRLTQQEIDETVEREIEVAKQQPVTAVEQNLKVVREIFAGDEPTLDLKQKEDIVKEYDNGLKLTIPGDSLKAVIQAAPETMGNNKITLEDIHDILFENEITYGVVDDSLIEGFLKYHAQKGEKFSVAEGKPPKLGRHGSIKYYFDIDHLKVGRLTEEGTIDYKDRGTIPIVHKGVLLSEKIHRIPSEHGMNIFGVPILVSETKDAKLRAGAGVDISEDGLKLFAKLDGQPQRSLGGKVSVFPEMTIKGDIGYKTGHVEFDGRITVNGSVQDNFHVYGASIKTNEILASEIKMSGDIDVKGGIIGANIKAMGQIKAKYINNAIIEACGDIIIQKEIIDSKIFTSGVCQVAQGAVVSSTIVAKRGIEVVSVGTQLSKASILKPGSEDHIHNEIERINGVIGEHRKKINTIKENEKAIEREQKTLEAQIAELAQVQDKSMVGKRHFFEKIEKANEKDKEELIKQSKQLIEELDNNFRKADEEIKKLFDKQEVFLEQILSLQKQIKRIEKDIDELIEDKKGLLEWSRKESPVPIAKIRKQIFEGTVVMGLHSQRVLEKTYRDVQIQETQVPVKDGGFKWEIRVFAQK